MGALFSDLGVPTRLAPGMTIVCGAPGTHHFLARPADRGTCDTLKRHADVLPVAAHRVAAAAAAATAGVAAAAVPADCAARRAVAVAAAVAAVAAAAAAAVAVAAAAAVAAVASAASAGAAAALRRDTRGEMRRPTFPADRRALRRVREG